MTFFEFAKLIKKKRESLFITQKEMAFRVAIAQSEYNKIENGNQEPDLTEILELKKPNSNEHKAYFD